MIFPFRDLRFNRLYHHSLFINLIYSWARWCECLRWKTGPHVREYMSKCSTGGSQTIIRRLLHLRPCEICWHDRKRRNLGLMREVAFSWNESGFPMTSRVDSSGRIALPCIRVSDTWARIPFCRNFFSFSHELSDSEIVEFLKSIS